MNGDFDGDGNLDVADWRPSDATWHVTPSKIPTQLITEQWGTAGDVPVAGDYDGDGKTDFAVWRPLIGKWYIIPSSNPNRTIIEANGQSGDIPVTGDFDGDSRSDLVVFRPSDQTWRAYSEQQSPHSVCPAFSCDNAAAYAPQSPVGVREELLRTL